VPVTNNHFSTIEPIHNHGKQQSAAASKPSQEKSFNTTIKKRYVQLLVAFLLQQRSIDILTLTSHHRLHNVQVCLFGINLSGYTNEIGFRIRRLKCGEERPSCHRCLRSGWTCDGYDHVVALSPASDRGPSYSISPTTPSPTRPIAEPSMLLVLTEQKQQYYHDCGKMMTGQLQGEDALFWQTVAFRESNTSYSVRHGLIAIGALKQSTTESSGRYQMDAVSGAHREIALQHYQKAIQSLRQSIPNLENPNSVRSFLVSCIILAIFDDFIGQGAFALRHMRYARQLVLDSNFLLPASASRGNEENATLVNMFLRLDVLTLCAMGNHDEYQTIPLQRYAPNFNLPSRLSSFDEAQRLSTLICWEGWNFFYYSAKFQLLPRNRVPPQVIDLRDYLIKQLYDLCQLLSELKEGNPAAIRHPLDQTKSLRLHPILILVRLVSSFGEPETACDALLDHFTYLVALSKDILQYEQLENPDVMGGPPRMFSAESKQQSVHSMTSIDFTMIPVAETYSAEVRTVSPLFLVATKCRNLSLRRQAIDLLLASHRREWMHDSLLCGQIGRWMMSLEEEDMDSNNYIPEYARVWGESVTLEPEGRGAKVKCRQNFRNRSTGRLDWRWKETYICW
jgi:hypothetical protein